MFIRTSLTTITPPATMLQAVGNVYKQLRIINEDVDDTITTEYIKAAVEYIETQTAHVFIPTQYIYTLDRWPYLAVNGYAPAPSAPTNGVIELTRAPLISVDQIQYIDTNGVLQTLTTDQYIVDTFCRPGRIWPKRFTYWPITDPMSPNAVQVTYTAGYSNSALIPFRANQAVRFLAAHWWENRLPIGEVGNDIPGTFKSVLRSLKITTYHG